MPFPLAHPAAVLPLRRYCPKFLSFPALVIGSITPDLGYFLLSRHLDELTHRLAGTFVFCLPVGLVLLGLFYALRPAVLRLPAGRYQQLFQPLVQRPSGPLFVNIFSLLIGSWTHLAWDSFTHNDGWVVRRVSALQYPVASVAGRGVQVCHVLWYLSSFIGVVWLFMSFMRWQRAVRGGASYPYNDFGFATLVALFLLPIELVHHLIPGGLGLALAGVGTLMLLLVILRRVAREQIRTEDFAESTEEKYVRNQ